MRSTTFSSSESGWLFFRKQGTWIECLCRYHSLVKNDKHTPMIIDIKMILETAVFSKRHANLSQNQRVPTEIQPEEAMVVAAPKQYVYRHGTDQLELFAGKGDVLRWHVCLTATDMLYVILYKIIVDPIDAHPTGIPEIAVRCRSFPIPGKESPIRYYGSARYDVFFEGKVNGYGRQYCTLLFYSVERDEVEGTLNTVGYFSWKSMLVIRESQDF
jgi:hypothetical protein